MEAVDLVRIPPRLERLIMPVVHTIPASLVKRQKVRWLPLADTKDDVAPEQWPAPIQRTSGECLCVVCKEPLSDHYQPAKLTCPTLVMDCADTWWKL